MTPESALAVVKEIDPQPIELTKWNSQPLNVAFEIRGRMWFARMPDQWDEVIVQAVGWRTQHTFTDALAMLAYLLQEKGV